MNPNHHTTTAPPHVSVIIPTRNRVAATIRAVESVEQQHNVDKEIIVVDDCSSHSNWLSLEALLSGRAHVIRLECHTGGAQARNEGARIAKGQYLAFLDSDDLMLPGMLETLLDAFQHIGGRAAVLACAYSDQKRLFARQPWRVTTKELFRANQLGGCSAALVRTSSCRDVGMFEPSLPSCQDWDLWLKLAYKHELWKIPARLVYRETDRSDRITGNFRKRLKGHLMLFRKHEALQSVYCFELKRLVLAFIFLDKPDYRRSFAYFLRSLLQERISAAKVKYVAAYVRAGLGSLRAGSTREREALSLSVEIEN